VRLDCSAGSEVTTIHGEIWQGESISGRPIESFDLAGGVRSYTAKLITGGRYYLVIGLKWSRFLDSGETGVASLAEITPG
jgi:hypothetical protein